MRLGAGLDYVCYDIDKNDAHHIVLIPASNGVSNGYPYYIYKKWEYFVEATIPENTAEHHFF